MKSMLVNGLFDVADVFPVGAAVRGCLSKVNQLL